MFGKKGNKKNEKSEKSNDKNEIAELQQHIHELEEDGKQKKIQLDRLEAELDDREEALEQKNGSLAHFSSQLKEREAQGDKLVEQIAKLSEEQETAQQKLRIESQAMHSLKDELAQSATVNTEGDAPALAELQQSLRLEESCASELQARNLDLRSKLETSQEELQERHPALNSESCEQVDRLRSECASLESAVQDQRTGAVCTEQQLVGVHEHAQKPALVNAVGEQENGTASKHVGQCLESAGQLLSPDLTTSQADVQSAAHRLVEDESRYCELQDELAKLREEMYVVEEERDDLVDRAVEAENQLAEERRNLACAQLESNDASRVRDVELQRLRECKDANITLEKRLTAALQDVKDRDMMLAAKEGDQRLTLMQQALEQQQELYTQSEERLSREEASAHSLLHEFSGAETELAAARLATDSMKVLKEQLQTKLSGLTSDLDLARHRMNKAESKEYASSAAFEHTAEEHAAAFAVMEVQSSKVIALQDELLHAEGRLSSGEEVNAQMAASLEERSEKDNLAFEEQNIARSHAKLVERLGVEVAEERSIAQSQASMLEDRLAAMGQELNERSEALVTVRDENGRCLKEAFAAEQEQRAYLHSQVMHVEDRLATNEISQQRLSEELEEARSNSIDANSRATRLEEELRKERSMTSQTRDEFLTCSKHVEQVPCLAEAKLHSPGSDANAPDKQTWEVDTLRHELVEERQCTDRLKKENADLERDMVDLVKMLNELKAAVRQYAVSGTGGT